VNFIDEGEDYGKKTTSAISERFFT
jgi:hypothetical protein